MHKRQGTSYSNQFIISLMTKTIIGIAKAIKLSAIKVHSGQRW